METIVIKAGATNEGGYAMEEVLVESLGDKEYQLLASPGIAHGMANGDRFKLLADGRFRVIERAGNVCIQIINSIQGATEKLESSADQAFARIGGWKDGKHTKLKLHILVYTVPVTVGFPAIENTIAEISSEFVFNWFYGNVYDEKDQPLNWW